MYAFSKNGFSHVFVFRYTRLDVLRISGSCYAMFDFFFYPYDIKSDYIFS